METAHPTKAHALLSAAQGLSSDQLDHLIAITKDLNRK